MFQEFADQFVAHKADIQTDISFHTNITTTSVAKTTQEIHALVKAMFASFQSPTEQHLSNMIKENAGQDVALSANALPDTEFLQKLIQSKATSLATSDPHHNTDQKVLTVEQLQEELSQDLKAILAQDAELFSQKLAVQTETLWDEIQLTVAREHDCGPHDRLLDMVSAFTSLG